MTTWNYIIGNEKDFEGAPEWATLKCYCSLNGEPNNDVAYCEGIFKGAAWKALTKGSNQQQMDYPDQWYTIAQREPVESPQWVYHLGTPEMFARMSKDVTHLFRNRLNGVVNGICSPAEIATYNARVDYELIGHRGLVTDAASVAINDSKYNRPCKGITIDVYDVLKAFNVTCPALQHLIKKALAVGQRGHKDTSEDLKDILASAKRAIELSENK